MTDRSIYRSVARRRFPHHRLLRGNRARRHSHERFIAEIELNFRSVSVSRSGILPIAIRRLPINDLRTGAEWGYPQKQTETFLENVIYGDPQQCFLAKRRIRINSPDPDSFVSQYMTVDTKSSITPQPRLISPKRRAEIK